MIQFIFSAVLAFCVIPFALSQSADYEHVEGGRFKKTIEYNADGRRMEGELDYNYLNKPILDRLLFGKTNSLVEYVCEPSFEDAVALRLVKHSPQESYKIEVIRFPDNQNIVSKISRNASQIIIPDKFQAEGVVSLAAMQQFHAFNKERHRIANEMYESYLPERISFKISNEFAEKLHETTLSLIDNFKAKGMPPSASFGGYNARFRCVVDDELWTLSVHMPQKRVLQMSDLCRQIIEDAWSDKFDEDKYARMLEQIEL